MVAFDPVCRELSEEKLLGWQSSAVSALWKSRTRKFKVQSSGVRAEDSKKFTPDETKYYKFYSDVLQIYAPDLFVKAAGKPEKFIDIGAAPGGMSKYLITTCGWRGYAFSLSPAEGGLEMKYYNPSNLMFSMANMSKEDEWKRVLSLCEKEGFKDVHFVNVGVVVDFGQVDADGGGNDEMARRSITSAISQLMIVISSLKEGGSAMWLHSLSHLDTFFFFMQYLVDCFDSIRILNTLSPARSPVYVILRGFKKKASKEFKQILSRNGGVVNSPTTIPDWQLSDFSVIERIFHNHPIIRSDIQAIWNQKRDCLKETRTFAEKRFGDGNESGSQAHGETKTDYTRVNNAAPTTGTGGLCSMANTEKEKAPTSTGSLLSMPKSFGPPSRKKPPTTQIIDNP
jgi:hypothetical protein